MIISGAGFSADDHAAMDVMTYVLDGVLERQAHLAAGRRAC